MVGGAARTNGGGMCGDGGRRPKGSLNGEPSADRYTTAIWHEQIVVVEHVLNTCAGHGRPRVQDAVALREDDHAVDLKVMPSAGLVLQVNTCNAYGHGISVSIGSGNGESRFGIRDT